MDLAAYLAGRSTGAGEPESGSPGEESAWLHFCELRLKSGYLQVGDASFIPSAEGNLFETHLQPGRYVLDARVLS